MAKTKRCPKCGNRTRSCFFTTKQAVATNSAGQTLVHPNGQPALGYPMRKCPKCEWMGDFIITPQTPAATPPGAASNRVPLDLLDDDDEDYINHYYH